MRFLAINQEMSIYCLVGGDGIANYLSTLREAEKQEFGCDVNLFANIYTALDQVCKFCHARPYTFPVAVAITS
ncbi:hypothetical protein BJP06_03735 [Corynebacterium sp. NML120713]|nr:hypothetical protein BJP06_03735 [Corynebacterium sp. NML120713]